jgi:hypothetical protein
MAPDDERTDALGAERAFELTTPRSPWWASSRLRLSFLLTGLAVALFGLLSTRGGLLDLGGGPSQATGAAFASGCPGRDAPEVASTTVGDLSALRDAAARIMPTSVGRVYEQGTITTSNLWTDDSPQRPANAPGSSAPAGYEIRWWALTRDGSEDDVVADVFEFATRRQAREALLRASSPRCRAHGESHTALLPSGASALAWVNPDSAEEWDVIFVRGQRLYRVDDVPPSYPAPTGTRQRRLKQLAVEKTVAVLACALPEADCPASAASAPPPDLAPLAVSPSAQSGSRGPVTRAQVSRYARAVNIHGYDVPGMTAVTRERATENLGYWREFARCDGERTSTHSFEASGSPIFRYAGRLDEGSVSSVVAVFSNETDADRYLAALASARARSCVVRSYERRLLSRHRQRDLRAGRLVAEPLPAATPASYRGLGPYRGAALRFTTPISYTTRRGRRAQLDSYVEGFVFACGRAVIGLTAESEFRPLAEPTEQYLLRMLVGRAEAYEGDLLGPVGRRTGLGGQHAVPSSEMG